MTIEQIMDEIESLVADAFNDGISCGHPLSGRGESRSARDSQKERIAALRIMLHDLISQRNDA